MPRKLASVKSFCKDDISKIENYELAKADNYEICTVEIIFYL